MTRAAAAAALLLALGAGCGPSGAKKVLCLNNLRELWMLHHAQGKRVEGKVILASSTGGAFWLELQGGGGSAADLESFVCPLSGRAPGRGVTTYRGPVKDVNTLAPSDVVGCCSGCHSDGSMSVLRKDGSVVLAEKGDPLQKQALEATKP